LAELMCHDGFHVLFPFDELRCVRDELSRFPRKYSSVIVGAQTVMRGGIRL